MENSKQNKPNPHASNQSMYVDLSEALSFWIVVIAIALVLNVLLAGTIAIQSGTPQYSILKSIYAFVLYGPGMIILPLITGAVIGVEIGRRAKNIPSALKVGGINAIYGVIIYLIAIIIIFEILTYALPSAGVTTNTLLDNWIILPVLIFIVTIEVLALISNSRKMQ